MFVWCSHGVLGDLTALLRRCRSSHGAAMTTLRCSYCARFSQRRATTRTLSMLKVRAVAWRPRRPHGVQWRCHGDAPALRATWRSAVFLDAARSPRGRNSGVTGLYTPVTLYRDYTEFARRCGMYRPIAEKCRKSLQIIFNFHKMEMLRRPYGDYGV